MVEVLRQGNAFRVLRHHRQSRSKHLVSVLNISLLFYEQDAGVDLAVLALRIVKRRNWRAHPFFVKLPVPACVRLPCGRYFSKWSRSLLFNLGFVWRTIGLVMLTACPEQIEAQLKCKKVIDFY